MKYPQNVLDSYKRIRYILIALVLLFLTPDNTYAMASEEPADTATALVVEEKPQIMLRIWKQIDESVRGGTNVSAAEAEEVIKPGAYPIMGKTVISVAQMVAYYQANGSQYPSDSLVSGGAPDIETFCTIYYEEAVAEGVKAEVAFAQTMKETGWLQYGGDSRIEQFNFAGLGTTGGGIQGNAFPDVRTGIRAQVQHLKAYATGEPLVQECVDGRYEYVAKGCAPYVEWLGQQENPAGKGWAVAPQYGYDIVGMINKLKGM